MHRWFAVLTILALAAPAPAHFIWIVPGKVPVTAQMVFSDELGPDANVPITKIAQTEVFVRIAGKPVEFKKTEEKDHYHIVARPSPLPPVEFGAVCKYGVLSKKGDPYLLMYYAKATVGGAWKEGKPAKGWDKLPLEILEDKAWTFHVLFHGKTVADVELTAIVPGEQDPRVLKRHDDGTFHLGAIPAVAGMIGLRAKYIEKKAGEVDGKKYAEIRHYSTWTFASGEKGKIVPAGAAPPAKPDPAATKLLADARAARAVWNNFPGFTSDLEVNVNGKIAKGRIDVASGGKLSLKLDTDDATRDWTRRTIASLVGHRLPGTDLDTPCAFLDNVELHPSGRAIRVLNDELHSSYRIRDRQIIEVNRVTKDVRFTITVLENTWTKEKQYLPVSYLVNTWDLKTNALVNSVAHHNAWTRIGAFDLPTTVRVVHAKSGELDNRLITFSNHQLIK